MLFVLALPAQTTYPIIMLENGEPMENRWQLFLGIGLVSVGAVFLLGEVLGINFWVYCWPIALIAAGAWLLMLPRMMAPGTVIDTVIIGDLRRSGSWKVQAGEIWLGISDVELDFSQAEIPVGETTIKIKGFVCDVDVYFPLDVGVDIQSSGFVVDSTILGEDINSFLSPIQVTSERYAETERRVKLEVTGFVVDLKVRQV
jgi:predicted membrane protein